MKPVPDHRATSYRGSGIFTGKRRTYHRRNDTRSVADLIRLAIGGGRYLFIIAA